MDRVAVILFNLGGPDRLDAVKPFLFNLFNDPAIVRLPQPLRGALAWLIASRRAVAAREIYALMGGGSPILPQTEAQAQALQAALRSVGLTQARCFTVMRYWHPRAGAVINEVQEFNPGRVVLLPLYPQFSTTTTASSLAEWRRVAAGAGLNVQTREVCCFPTLPGFIRAYAGLIRAAAPDYFGPVAHKTALLLFSAHGLPQRIADAGDPYPEQVRRTARAIAGALGLRDTQWEICYQSRVGPLAWTGPSTIERIRAAGAQQMPLVLAPIAFVSEHSETLVELDIEYRALAASCGVPEYVRVPAVGVNAEFIGGLATLVQAALSQDAPQ